MSASDKDKMSRRSYLKYAAGAVVAAAVGAGAYAAYQSTQAPPTPTGMTETSVVTSVMTQAPTTLPPSTAKYNFYYLPPNLIEDWHVACWQGGVQWAKQVGINLTTIDSNNDVSRQIATARTLATLKPDGVVMIGIDDTAAQAAEVLGAAGIPTIIVDRDLVSDKIPLYCAFGSEAAGQQVADIIAAALKQKYGSEQGEVIVSQGDLSAAPGFLRNKGFMEEIAKFPNIKIVNQHQSPKFTVDTSITRLAAALAALGHAPDAIAVHYTGAGIAAMQDLAAKGWLHKIGEDGHVIVAGIDASPAVVGNVAQGYIETLIDQPNLDYVPLGLYFLMKIKEVGMANAIPKAGTTVQSSDIPLATLAPNPVNGINPWTQGIWAPAPVVDMPDYKHPQMQCKGFIVNQSTVTSDQIFGNVLPKWYPLPGEGLPLPTTTTT
jgi:ribose transport system substrate-binding protein